MDSSYRKTDGKISDPSTSPELRAGNPAEVESLLTALGKFLRSPRPDEERRAITEAIPSIADRYKVLVEQIPAVVFMAFLDGGVSEAYVSPQVEEVLGFSRDEWLDDPVRWFYQIHPDDRQRWSVDAAEILLKGNPLRSVYRVIARDGHVVWFRCEVRLVRRQDGEPWFVHGVGFDITDLKRAEQALQGEMAERERLQRLELERQIKQSEELRALSFRLLKAQDDERRHLARELHDSTGQILAVLAMNLGHIVQAAKQHDPELAKHAEDAEELVQQLSEDVRTTSYLLHPPLLDEMGLSSALSWYIEGLERRSGLKIELSITEDVGRLPGDMELVIFRLVQECLTNVHRHSESKNAAIRITRGAESISVEVKDEGKGMSPERLTEIQSQGSGVGIRGMCERLRQFRGDLVIESGSSGTRISAALPVPKDVNSSQPAKTGPLETAV